MVIRTMEDITDEDILRTLEYQKSHRMRWDHALSIVTERSIQISPIEHGRPGALEEIASQWSERVRKLTQSL